MATRKSLTNMSLDELRAYNLELREEIVALREKKRAIAAELDRRAALEKLATLSDAEKQLLAQLIATEGIPSGGAVGTPGKE